jgi:hypothetical protein
MSDIEMISLTVEEYKKLDALRIQSELILQTLGIERDAWRKLETEIVAERNAAKAEVQRLKVTAEEDRQSLLRTSEDKGLLNFELREDRDRWRGLAEGLAAEVEKSHFSLTATIKDRDRWKKLAVRGLEIVLTYLGSNFDVYNNKMHPFYVIGANEFVEECKSALAAVQKEPKP